MADAAQAELFLTTLFALAIGMDDVFITTVCMNTARNKKIQADSWRPANLTACAEFCARVSQYDDVYVEVGLSRTAVQGPHRHKADDIVSVPALWIDVDVKAGAATDLGEALARVATMAPAPTIIVDSGNGLHAYWGTDALIPAQAAAVLAPAWVKAVAGPWKLDPVGDLARILRVPGTLNHKPGSRPVALLQSRPGEHNVNGLAAVISDAGVRPVGPAAPAAGTAGAPPLEGTNGDIVAQAEALLRGAGWDDTMLALYENNPDIRGVVERSGQGHAGWSDNEFDLAVASHADLMSLDAPTTAALMIYSREEFGINPDNRGKTRARPKYTTDTIIRGKSHPKLEARQREAESSESSQQAFRWSP